MSGPRALRVRLAGLTLVMLGAALAFGEDAARKAPPDPDPGLLEFLGSVDGLAEVSRSEEHTSELQSRLHLVCRLLLEKKINHNHRHARSSTHHITSRYVILLLQ